MDGRCAAGSGGRAASIGTAGRAAVIVARSELSRVAIDSSPSRPGLRPAALREAVTVQELSLSTPLQPEASLAALQVFRDSSDLFLHSVQEIRPPLWVR